MDGTELDEIMNEALAPITTSTETTTETAEQQQTRDEQGRFAPNTAEPTDQAAQAAIEGQQDRQGTVPQQALHAEREKGREAREEAEALRRELAELRGQVTALTPKAMPQEQPKPTNFYTDPDKALSERLTPIQQQVQQARMETSMMLAEEKFGADKLKAADDELGKLMQANDPSVAAIAQQMATSKHPYRDLIAWHEKRQAMSEIGDDPTSFRTRIAAEERAKVLAELGIEPDTAATAAVAQATPSITKPLIKLPQSLSKLPGAGNGNGVEDTSDTGLFQHAMGGR